MLRLRRDLLDAMVAHCRAEHPLEACGVLAGRDGVPERHIPMRNAEASRTRYAMDPDEQLAVWRDIDQRGEEPVVIYHSHPATEAVPSAPDVEFAGEPGAHYVIVSTRGDEPEVRSYRIADGEAAEEPVTVIYPQPAGRTLYCAPSDLPKAQTRTAVDPGLAGAGIETHPWLKPGTAVLVDHDALAEVMRPSSWEWLP
jgi:proteasome lid subunit RPN8/RPN11